MAGAANGGGRSTVGAALERRRNAAAAAAAAASATDNASSSSSSNSAGAISPYNNNGSSSSNTSEALKDAQKAFQWLSARTSFAGKGLDHSSGQGAGTVQLMAPGTRQMPLWATSTLSLLKSIYPEVSE
jgi:activator of HSP90 ATPase